MKLKLSPSFTPFVLTNPALTSRTYIALKGGVYTVQVAGVQGGKSCSINTACLLALNHMMSKENLISCIQKLHSASWLKTNSIA